MNKDLHPRSLVSCENLKEGESPIFQHSTTFIENGGKLISTFRCIPEANTVCKLIKAANIKYGKFPCIGEREKTNDGNLGKYRWISYSEFYIQVKRFAAGLQMMGLKKGDKVGIYSVNCPWWQRTAFACYVSSLVPVPIYDSLGPGAAEYILEHSECIAVVVSQEKLGALRLAIQSTNENKIRNVMVIGDFQETNENGISYQSCDSVYADEGTFRLEVTPQQAKTLAPYIGKEVTFGIRPEDVEFSHTPIDGKTINGHVSVVEPLGSETQVYVSTSKAKVVGKIDPTVIPEPDEAVALIVNMEKAKFFDLDTEVTIR